MALRTFLSLLQIARQKRGSLRFFFDLVFDLQKAVPFVVIQMIFAVFTQFCQFLMSLPRFAGGTAHIMRAADQLDGCLDALQKKVGGALVPQIVVSDWITEVFDIPVLQIEELQSLSLR